MNTQTEFDVIIIGGGIVGAAAAYYLSRYNLSCALLEAGSDVAGGATRANSGIVHAGYDCEIGSLKAKYNVLGNKLYRELANELHLNLNECGSLVVAEEDGLPGLQALLDKAKANGVSAKIIAREEILKLEPNVADGIEYALYAPSGAVVSPYKTAIALIDAAVLNGVKVFPNSKITKMSDLPRAKYVVNAAGAGAAEINAMFDAEEIKQVFRRGEYLLLDNATQPSPLAGYSPNLGENYPKTVIFPLPTERGKGILVAPTADGNVIYGPTSEKLKNYSTATSKAGLDEIKREVARTFKNPDFKSVIKVYAGVRTLVGEDFVVGFSKICPNLFVTAGICSPGLTSAPAIGQEIAKSIAEKLNAPEKKREELVFPAKKQKPAFGNMICRCEYVTEAEVVAAIHSPFPATTVDAVKRRCRTGMGRCGGGFCTHAVMKILARELNLPVERVQKENSNIITGVIKETYPPPQVALPLSLRGNLVSEPSNPPLAKGGNRASGGGYVTLKYDVLVLGGGSAGMAAAIEAADCGRSVALLEMEESLGGILKQCIHNGFGLHYFKEELTGPEYAARFEEILKTKKVDVFLGTMVTEILPNKTVYASNRDGLLKFHGKAVVIAFGARERTAGNICLNGTRPAGVYTAGFAQKLINIDGFTVGKNVVILGSGDIGLIMARRLTFEGAKVLAVLEIMKKSSGLARNIVQCLNDFDIPLRLSTTVSRVEGTERVTGVWVAPVDENLNPINEKEEFIPCDCLLLSVGLIPYIPAGEKLPEGFFGAGNALKIYDLVDNVTTDGQKVGRQAAEFAARVGEKSK